MIRSKQAILPFIFTILFGCTDKSTIIRKATRKGLEDGESKGKWVGSFEFLTDNFEYAIYATLACLALILVYKIIEAHLEFRSQKAREVSEFVRSQNQFITQTSPITMIGELTNVEEAIIKEDKAIKSLINSQSSTTSAVFKKLAQELDKLVKSVREEKTKLNQGTIKDVSTIISNSNMDLVKKAESYKYYLKTLNS